MAAVRSNAWRYIEEMTKSSAMLNITTHVDLFQICGITIISDLNVTKNALVTVNVWNTQVILTWLFSVSHWSLYHFYVFYLPVVAGKIGDKMKPQEGLRFSLLKSN